jgi:tetrahydromethanopterin S-methyltransferase subunit G
MTRSRNKAFRAGAGLHGISAFVFAVIYAFAMMHLGLAHFPTAFFAGIGFGILHGIVVSLMLVWIVAERHPLAEFQEAGLAVGLSHFAGHVAYGAIVGLVIGLSPL